MSFPLFETLAIIEGHTQNLTYHQQRYQNSLSIFYAHQPYQVYDLGAIIPLAFTYFLQQTNGKTCPSLLRCRVDYNATNYHIDFFDYTKKSYHNFQPVICDTIDYPLKFTNRQIFTNLLTLKGNSDEIMIIKNGFVTDCTIGNLVFKKQGEWFTPTTPLLLGTQRAKLLKAQKINERVIRLQDIDKFEAVQLINALNELTI